ncbi:MAG: hypothetical protein HWN81_00020 [Candidatus Lokiarchaeota archaeon]|nr:hypothetical protein [Candidatus Lokiarchaeota archaeon]
MKKVIEMLKKRVKGLGREITNLVEERGGCVERIKSIDVRLDQLAGTIHELNNVIVELGGEGGKDNRQKD